MAELYPIEAASRNHKVRRAALAALPGSERRT
jgi:hypothetical protein